MGHINEDKYFNELVSELEQCREDERSAQNQQLQTIAAAGAILAGVYAVASLLPENKGEVDILMVRILFYMSSIILVVIISYITSLGISNVLRYHYMRNLEDRLYNLRSSRSDEKSFVHWMSFSSPITTRNLLHINTSVYTIVHYVCYLVATFGAIAFCIIMTILQYTIIPKHSFLDNVLLYILFGSMFLILGVFVWISIKSEKMYTLSAIKAVEKRNLRLSNFLFRNTKRYKRPVWKKFIYFFYPKKKDFQKSILIVAGFAAGTWMDGGSTDLYRSLLNGFFCWLFLDFLIYQARYLWNDIRGIDEDVLAGKTERLPVKELGGKKAVGISSAVIFLRLSLALLFIQFFSREMRPVFIISLCVIIIISILYEIARERKWDVVVFFLVSLGYPIRVFAGCWAAYPSMWTDSILGREKVALSTLVLLFLVYMCVGEISAVLPWTHEAVTQIKSNKRVVKSHYIFLFLRLKERGQAQLPLREKGELKDVWNIFVNFH